MNENEVALAVTAWARATLPELSEGRHFLSAQKTTLPDVMVDVDEKSRVREHPAFNYVQLQQIDLRVFELSLAFMVESEGAGPDDAADQDETEELRDYGARLETALVEDATLGDRVPMASPFVTFNYRLPFVEYADGTRGRQMNLTMWVAEPIPSDN
jgi:hypothetical protein